MHLSNKRKNHDSALITYLQKPAKSSLKLCLLYSGWLMGYLPVAGAEEMYFDPNSLDPRGGGVAADLDIFSHGEQLPGVYRVDIYLNHSRIENREVTFVMDDRKLSPLFTVRELDDMGVNTSAFSHLVKVGADKTISDIGKYISEATTEFDFSRQRLDILVPQASLKTDVRNSVDPTQWDQGIPVFILNYNLTGSRYNYDNSNDTSNAFLNLGTGANLGAWRLRNNSTYTYTKNNAHSQNYYNYDDTHNGHYDDTGDQQHWQSINTYIQRDIQRLEAQLTLGETTTSGTLFDSLSFRGAQIASDDSMLPDSQRGFAPVVRGIVNSSAQITIRQNGYVIYQIYVAPGPYAIRDLYATAGSGDLQVTVKEENGNERTFIQPYSSVPLMQREGRLRYEFSAGQYRSTVNSAREPGFGQGSLIYGISNTNTIYGGITGSPDYAAALFGVGQGLGDFGSISLDVTQANTRLADDSEHQGQSYRLQYSKDIFQSGTTFTLAGYRYSTSGYYDFNEANEVDSDSHDYVYQGYNKRSRLQVQVSQTMGDLGSLYLTAYQQDYWGKEGYERNTSAGYNINLKGISLALSFNNTENTEMGGHDYQYALSVQIPLSRFLSNSWITFSTQADSQHRATQSVTLNGQVLENNNLNYMVRESVGNKGQGNGGGGNLYYKGTYGNLQTGYSYTKNSQQYTAGLQGGIIVHPYGLTLSQPLGDTVTLIRAPGASGVQVQNQPGVSTDWRGYAVVPYAVNYRANRIGLSPQSLNDNVDILETVQTVTPTKGAVVLANFDTRIGSRVLVTVRNGNQYVPFGTTATLYSHNIETGKEEELSHGIVGEKGELYMSGVPNEAYVKLRWGKGIKEACVAKLQLVDAPLTSGIVITSALCHTQ